MIVKMQKVTLLVLERETEQALEKLRKLGVLHIKHINQPSSKEISILEQNLSDINEALSTIERAKPQKCNFDYTHAVLYAKEIITLKNDKQKLLTHAEKLQHQLQWFQTWGEINPSDIEMLKEAGISVKFYECPKNLTKAIPSDKLVHIIKERGKTVLLAIISLTGEKISLPFNEVEIPHRDRDSLKRELENVLKKIEFTDNMLKQLANYKDYFLHFKSLLLKKIEFYRVKSGMGKEEGFSYLQGFCPVDKVKDVHLLAVHEHWALLVEEPDNPDEVPTLLRNPRWIEIINPVFKFMGTLPGYNEYDISFWFLLFFSIFFALLIGDAGYGFFFLITTFLAQKKMKNIPKQPFFLMYVLSTCTILWGASTGTWFGFEKIAQIPFLNSLIIGKINSFINSNQRFMMYLCFIIGVVHLSIAHGIIALRIINSLKALAQLGWILILWGIFFVAGHLVLDKPFPSIAQIFLISGISLVILFSHPNKNILKGIGTSLGELPLKVISSFSDIVSYLRLFAVGYASVVVASSFNDMALQAGFNNFLTGFFAALILFLGHSLNILLGLMAVIVHGIRLNMLEFSGHLNMQWSGEPYSPFKE